MSGCNAGERRFEVDLLAFHLCADGSNRLFIEEALCCLMVENALNDAL